MKKLNFSLYMLAISALMIVSEGAQAQKSENIMDLGTITVNIGIGLGRSAYGGGVNGLGYGTGFGTKVAIERGMWQFGPGVLSLGLEAGGSFSNTNYSGYKYKSNIVIIAARSAYHFGWNVPKLDTYGGVSIGPGFRSFGSSGSKSNDVVIAPGIFVGGSYYFSPKIGVNVEAGYDITQFRVVLYFN